MDSPTEHQGGGGGASAPHRDSVRPLGPRTVPGVVAAYSGVVFVPALVLILAALVVGIAGVLAALHRLPRNRVLGVRTAWTMTSVDAFRRADRVAAPAFVAAGVTGLAAGTVGLTARSTATALTVLVISALGLVALVGSRGVVGMRFAVADEAEVRGAFAGPATPCAAGEPQPEEADGACEPVTAGGACGGSCALCPRARVGVVRQRLTARRRGCGEPVASGVSDAPHRWRSHQPQVPGPPLNGPTTSAVIQPP